MLHFRAGTFPDKLAAILQVDLLYSVAILQKIEFIFQ